MNLSTKFQTQLLTFLIVGFLGLLAERAVAQKSTDYPKKPNFIIIFADDLGYGDLGIYGHPTINTPNLDRMAIEGQKWTNFYVGASVCTPSRAALLTGRLPVRSGMASNKSRVLFPNSANGLPLEEITLAEQLKTEGYGTACIGKWHLGHKEKYLPTNHGFDYYYGVPYSNDMDLTRELEPPNGYWDLWTKEYESLQITDFNVPLIRNNTIIERPVDQHTITKRYTDESIQWIRKNKENPFFLYLAYNLPHVPLFASKEFKDTSRRGLYGDVVEEIDHNVGRIITTLKEEDLAENTIVVFTSDNGPWLPTEISGGSAGLLRNGKGSTWEGGMREPCIFWSPNNIKPKVVMDMGTTMDLFETFSNLAGVAVPSDREMDGVDLSPVLFDNGNSPRNVIYYYRGRDLFAVRVGSFKAHFITQGAYHKQERVEHNPPLLYNLDEDPSERFDVSKKFPEIINEIRELVRKHNSRMVMGPDLLELKE